jgi:hypothetical protein
MTGWTDIGLFEFWSMVRWYRVRYLVAYGLAPRDGEQRVGRKFLKVWISKRYGGDRDRVVTT